MKIKDMKIKDLENMVKSKISLLDYARQKYNCEPVGTGTYRINPCPVCGHRDHFTIYPETNSYYSFSGCCQGGGFYRFLIEVEGFTGTEAYNELCKLAGVEPNSNREAVAKQIKEYEKQEVKEREEGIPKEQRRDITNWILQSYATMTEEQRNYFRERGLSDEIIDKYKLCIINTFDGLRAFIPFWNNDEVVYYTGRALEEQEPKYRNASGGNVFFNGYLLEQNVKILIVCEGAFDALTVEEATGIPAIALNSANNVKKLLKVIESKKINRRNTILLTAFDNDEAGIEATELAMQYGFRPLRIPSIHKDVNEWLIKDKKEMRNTINTDIRRPDAVSLYLIEDFDKDRHQTALNKDRKTGFNNLDAKLHGLYSGLYVIGGISSVGKTTFVHQLADQIAGQGEHIIFFSLEQSRLELVSKSIARQLYEIDKKQAITSLEIRNEEWLKKNDNIQQAVGSAISRYRDLADRISIIEGNYRTTVESIRTTVEDYIEANDVKPVVFVDYLQVLPCAKDNLTDKQRIDYVVTELKRLSRDLDIVLFVVSSLNRDSYLNPISFESFKESGGIEYTADVILGLQLDVFDKEVFNKENNKTARRQLIQEEKARDVRKVELVCLKNRYGKSSFNCNYKYYAKYDYFEEYLKDKDS